MQKKQERDKRAANRKNEIQTIARAKSADYQRKAKDRQKKIAQNLNKDKGKTEAYDGANILNFMLEQIEDTNTNPTTYFFYDDSELEITVKEAAYIVTKFMELSDDHKEAWIDNVGNSKQFLSDFINM